MSTLWIVALMYPCAADLSRVLPDSGPGVSPAADDTGAPEPPDPQVLLVHPPARNTVLLAAASAALLVAAVLSDTGGRLLVVPAALVAVALTVRDLTRGPLLRADRVGVELLAGWRRVGSDWSGVERVRAVKDRTAAVLEVDLGETVVALSRTRLGRHPADLVEELERLRGPGPP